MEAHLWATQPLRGQFSFQANMAALLLWALQNLLLARARARRRVVHWANRLPCDIPYDRHQQVRSETRLRHLC